MTLLQVLRPGRAVSKLSLPPMFLDWSDKVTWKPCLAAIRAASRPAGPAPIISSRSSLDVLLNFSGCQFLRHSSPAVAFWVQRTGTPSCQLDMQMLQPMHSLISSSRPAFILLGRNGSAMPALAPPMRSRMPRLICDVMVSGEVKRPTPTTGLSVICLTKSIMLSCEPSGLKREALQSVGLESILTSQRSGASDNSETTSWASDSKWLLGFALNSSRLIRSATAQLSPTASRVASINSCTNRTRLATLPP